MLHMDTYLMGLQPLQILYSFSAGIDFRVGPRAKRGKYRARIADSGLT